MVSLHHRHPPPPPPHTIRVETWLLPSVPRSISDKEIQGKRSFCGARCIPGFLSCLVPYDLRRRTEATCRSTLPEAHVSFIRPNYSLKRLRKRVCAASYHFVMLHHFYFSLLIWLMNSSDSPPPLPPAPPCTCVIMHVTFRRLECHRPATRQTGATVSGAASATAGETCLLSDVLF